MRLAMLRPLDLGMMSSMSLCAFFLRACHFTSLIPCSALPGPRRHIPILWPLLAPVGSAASLDAGCQVAQRIRQASPGKTTVFRSVHPPHLLWTAFRLRLAADTLASGSRQSL
jgi:hypothetical protein